MEDSAKITRDIIEAVRTTGTRAIISRGWSKLGAGNDNHPGVLFIDDCPHGIAEILFGLLFKTLTHSRMVIQTRSSSDPSRRGWYNGLWLAEW